MSVEIFDGCDVCGEDHDTEHCPELGCGSKASSQALSRARLTLPHFVEVKDLQNEHTGVFASQTIAEKTRLGPYEARKTTQNIVSDFGFVLKVLIKDGTSVSLDTTDENECNWLCLVQTADSNGDQNCMAIQIGTEIFYSTTKTINPGEELRVWYAPHYARKLGKPPNPDGKTKAQELTLPEESELQTPQADVDVGSGLDTENLSPGKSASVASNNLKTTTQKRRARDSSYKCPECGILLPTQYILDQHRVIHKAQIKVENAGPPTTVVHDDDDDEDTANAEDDLFTKLTPNTAAAFSSLTDPRQLHVKYQHSCKGTKKCVRCGEEFDDMQLLAKHVQQHIIEADRMKKRESAMSDSYTPRKRGRPKGSKNKKVVISDDDEEGFVQSSLSIQKVIHTYERVKSPDGSPDSVRKSRRIKAGIESGKITLSTRIKQEMGDELLDEESAPPRPKHLPMREGESGEVFVPPVKRKRGRPRKYPVLPTQVISIDADSSDAAMSDTTRESTKTGAEPPRKRPALESLLKSPPPSITDAVNAAVAKATSASGESEETSDKLVKNKEVTISIPDDQNNMSSDYMNVSALINLDGIDIIERDNTDATSAGKRQPGEQNANESATGDGQQKPGDENADKSSRRHAGADDNTREEGEVIFTSTDGQVTCSVCNEVIGGKEELSKHQCKLDDADTVNIFTCDICNKSFDKENYLKRHVEGHDTEAKCDGCGKLFARKESLKTHICPSKAKTHGGIIDKKHFCEFCGAAFANERYLARHMASHTGEFKCEQCNRTFARKESLLFHMKKCDPAGLIDKAKGFPCSLCHRVFSREVSLQNHMAVHNEEFKCNDCDKAFSSAIRQKNHECVAQKVDPNGDTYTCQHEGCGKTFAKELYLNRHMTLHTGQFSCVICSKRYGRKEELIRHMLECTASVQVETTGEIVCTVCKKNFDDAASFRTHFQEHTHPYKCNDCGKMFLRKTNFEAHSAKCVPWDGDPVECKKCGKKFRTPLFLQRHSVVHEEPKYKCDSCGKKFHRLDYYNDHMCVDAEGKKIRIKRTRNKTEIVDRKPQHICPTCGKSYVSISNLNKHMLTHGEKTEVCLVCHKRFHLKISLKEHMKMVHTDKYNYQCPHCKKSMKCRNSMYGHIAQFHSKTLVLYQCQRCGKRFRQKGNLKKHILTHSDKKTYSCKFCQKTFKFPEQIRRHELLHTHGHRFKCDMCDKTFVMEFEKRKHMTTYHGGIVYVCKYCLTDCHHFHTMKRHLARRHFDIPEWQTDTTKFIQSLIKSDESDEYHHIRKERGDQVGVIIAQPGQGAPIEIQAMSTEGPQTLLNPETGQIQIIKAVSQGVVTDAAHIVTEDGHQVISGGDFQVIAAGTDAVVTSDLGALVEASVEGDDPVVAHLEQLEQLESNTVVLVTQAELEGGAEGIADVNMETPMTIDDQSSVTIPGVPLADGQGPFIVAEVQGLSSTGQNQTFIIHGAMDLDPETFMTKEMAEALQSLTNSGALGDEQRVIQIGNVMNQEEMLTGQTIFVSPSNIEEIEQAQDETQ